MVITPFKDPTSKYSQILKYCGLGLQHMNLGAQNSAHNRTKHELFLEHNAYSLVDRLGPADLTVRVSSLGDMGALVGNPYVKNLFFSSGHCSYWVKLGLMSVVVLVNFSKPGSSDGSRASALG